MTYTTKVDLSREAVERLADAAESADYRPFPHGIFADTLRALLDAKEAREAECRAASDLIKSLKAKVTTQDAQLTEARASAAAAWEAGRDAARECGGHYMTTDEDVACFNMWDEDISELTNPDPDATEALRRVEEAVWDEAYQLGIIRGQRGIQSLNPYAAKEAAHG